MYTQTYCPSAPAAPPSHFYAGLDLGQRTDPAAIAVLEFRQQPTGCRDPLTFQHIFDPQFCLRLLRRLPLGTSYTVIGDKVRSLLGHPDLHGRATLIVDASGPGIPFLDFFTTKSVPANLVRILITSGGIPHFTNNYHHVPRATLFDTLATLLQTGILHINPDLPESQNLLQELAAIDITSRSRAPHDDLAMATALAAWQAVRQNRAALQLSR